jgi:hypothetical protein
MLTAMRMSSSRRTSCSCEIVSDKKRRTGVLKAPAAKKKSGAVSNSLDEYLDVSLCHAGVAVQNKEPVQRRKSDEEQERLRCC